MILILDNNNNRAIGLHASLTFIGETAQLVDETKRMYIESMKREEETWAKKLASEWKKRAKETAERKKIEKVWNEALSLDKCHIALESK